MKFVIIFSNYVTVILYLLALLYILRASRKLNASIKPGGWYYKSVRSVVVPIVTVISAVYVWLVFRNPFRTVSSDPLVRPTYFLPDWLIVLTIVAPYIFIWLCGSLAV